MNCKVHRQVAHYQCSSSTCWGIENVSGIPAVLVFCVASPGSLSPVKQCCFLHLPQTIIASKEALTVASPRDFLALKTNLEDSTCLEICPCRMGVNDKQLNSLRSPPTSTAINLNSRIIPKGQIILFGFGALHFLVLLLCPCWFAGTAFMSI